MPMRMGEMMVVVRAQDFASRTLRRVSGELAGMSRAQQLTRASTMAQMRSMGAMARLAKTSETMGNLQTLQQQIDLQKRLNIAEQAQLATASRLKAPIRSSIWRAQTRELESLRGEMAGLQGTINKMPSSFQKLQFRQEALTTAMAAGAAQQRMAGMTLGLAAEEVQALDGMIRRLPIDRLDDIGHAMGGVGRTMQLAGAVMTATFALSSNAYADFNQQVTLAATQTRAAGESFIATAKNANRLSLAILDMMGDFPATAEDMSKAAYDIFSSIDVNFNSGIKLLRLFNKVAVAGGVDLTTATQASISVLENFDTQLVKTGRVGKETYQILNRMFAIVRYGRMNFAQFNDMLNSVVPAATGAQQSFDDVAGAMAFLTRRIPSQARAATSLSRLLDVFIDRDFQTGMRKAGLAIEDMSGRLLPLPEIIDRIAALEPKRLTEVIRAITAFGRGQGRGREYTIQARRALVQLISGIDEYRRVQSAVVADNDEFNNSFAAMSQTLGVQWKVFLNQLKVLVLYVGQQAIPVFLRIGETISGWIDKWQRLSESTRRNIIQWGAIIGVGTLVGGVLLSIVGSLVTLTASLIRILPSMATVRTGLHSLFLTARGLKSLGLITIGIELMRKGGNWETLGRILTAAGIGYGIRGGRGAAIAGTIAIGVSLKPTGDGWRGRLGQILLGAGAGAVFGGAPGAIIGGSLAAMQVGLREARTEAERWERFTQTMQKIKDFKLTIRTIGDERQLNTELQKMFRRAKEISSTQGEDAAYAFMNAFIERGTRRLQVGTDRFSDAMDRMRVPDVDKRMTLREALKSAKSFTEIMEIVNRQMNTTASSAERLAVAIARAFSRGNLGKANALVNQFVESANQKLTASNISKLISEAVESGDISKATDLLNQWNSQVRQGREEWKNYQEQLVQTTQQASEQALNNLRDMYSQMAQVNREAFGELFQGPWLTSETFDLAKEWGITPRIQDMIRDLHAQNAQFAKWRQSLDKLMKRGLPREFIDELRQMGPETGQPLLDQIMSAKPAQVNKLIAEWKRRENQIKQATKMDFREEIEQFRKAGGSMGQAIIDGFQQVGVGSWFDSWVKQTFPDVINAAVSQAVRDWKSQTPMPERPQDRLPTGATSQNRGGIGTKPTSSTTTTTDNSKKATINIHPPGGEAARDAAREAEARRLAFIAVNAARKILG